MKGTYERTAADKYDEFLTALDVNMLLRKAAASSFPPFMTVSVSEETGEWTIKTWAMLNKEDGSLMLKMKELKFKLGEEFEEKTPDGREVKAVVTQEGDKLITVQTAKKEGEKSTKMTREFFDDKCVVTIEITGSDVVCTQTFTRRNETDLEWRLKRLIGELASEVVEGAEEKAKLESRIEELERQLQEAQEEHKAAMDYFSAEKQRMLDEFEDLSLAEGKAPAKRARRTKRTD